MKNFNIKIFADGADKKSMIEMAKNWRCQGLTTNPTLMAKSGITDYKTFALDILSEIKDKPISFEVFSDEFDEMKRQALEIASWQNNVYVKIPITNTRGESSCDLIKELSHNGVKINVTAIFTSNQVNNAFNALKGGEPSVISIFAGRIADSGVNPTPIITGALNTCFSEKQIEILWASPRELYNIIEAEKSGCHIITVAHDLLNKLHLFGKNLEEFSLDTIKMFYEDGKKAGFKL